MILSYRNLGRRIGHKKRDRTIGMSPILGERRPPPRQTGPVEEDKVRPLRLLSDRGRARWGNQGGFALGRRQGIQGILGVTEMVVAEAVAGRHPEEHQVETQGTPDSEQDSQWEPTDR